MNSVDDLAAVALLAEPVRQRLYRYLRDRREPVGREEAAASNAGISVKLAAFHLDRMVEAGLLEVGYRRLTGRVGPGAGRPAKVYSLTQRAFEITLPQTRYALAASMMADRAVRGHLRRRRGALEQVAGDVGEMLGAETRALARTQARPPGGRDPPARAARLRAAAARLRQTSCSATASSGSCPSHTASSSAG